MVELTKTMDKQIGQDRFQIACISYEGVREASGFQRRVLTRRPQYKVNGKVVSRAVFFTMKEAATSAGRPVMARFGPKAVLAKMMQELVENDWPSDETWEAACRVLGRPPPRPLRPGKPVPALVAVTSSPRHFEP